LKIEKEIMKIYLRDLNSQLVDAWRMFFQHEPDVEVSEGDIWGVKADAIVSPANSYGFMDGGIDYVYTERFGSKMQDDLQAEIAANHYGELPVGQALTIKLDDPDYKWLISAPTMRVPMNVNGTVNAYLAFRATLIAALEHNRKQEEAKDRIFSLLCPGLGTMVGKLPVMICAQQMFLAYRLIMRGDNLEFMDIGSAYVADRKLRGVMF
jgi:O-acetyl-ADP-ribose deacetylase (regulator of RNase III)